MPLTNLPKRVVLAICGDPGGAAATAPVLLELRTDPRVMVKVFAYKQALPFWQNRGLEVSPLDEHMSPAQVEELMRSVNPDLVFAGTSVNGVDLEKQFIARARALNIPSCSLLDFWSNYRARFADESGSLSFFPNKIAVMDQRARTEMIAAGFDP